MTDSKNPDRKSTRLNSSHRCISYAVFCLKKKKRSPSKRYINEGAKTVIELSIGTMYYYLTKAGCLRTNTLLVYISH